MTDKPITLPHAHLVISQSCLCHPCLQCASLILRPRFAGPGFRYKHSSGRPKHTYGRPKRTSGRSIIILVKLHRYLELLYKAPTDSRSLVSAMCPQNQDIHTTCPSGKQLMQQLMYSTVNSGVELPINYKYPMNISTYQNCY